MYAWECVSFATYTLTAISKYGVCICFTQNSSFHSSQNANNCSFTHAQMRIAWRAQYIHRIHTYIYIHQKFKKKTHASIEQQTRNQQVRRCMEKVHAKQNECFTLDIFSIWFGDLVRDQQFYYYSFHSKNVNEWKIRMLPMLSYGSYSLSRSFQSLYLCQHLCLLNG